jgi:hypothetical protein
MFPLLADIVNTKMTSFKLLPLEIETTLVEVLALVSESEVATKDPITVAAKRRVVQQGFMEHFLIRISSLTYSYRDESSTIFGENAYGNDMNELGLNQNDQDFTIDG